MASLPFSDRLGVSRGHSDDLLRLGQLHPVFGGERCHEVRRRPVRDEHALPIRVYEVLAEVVTELSEIVVRVLLKERQNLATEPCGKLRSRSDWLRVIKQERLPDLLLSTV